MEEELDQIEETAQQSEADASSELVTQSIVSQKRQKYEIYLKLLRMLFLIFRFCKQGAAFFQRRCDSTHTRTHTRTHATPTRTHTRTRTHTQVCAYLS